MPFWYNSKPNNSTITPSRGSTALYDENVQHAEGKFHIPLKTKLWNSVFDTPLDLWFGYTQKSYWQLYNTKWSSPFRDTDYEPEVIAILLIRHCLLVLTYVYSAWERYINRMEREGHYLAVGIEYMLWQV